jgi:putative glycosyltransferase (TIGR04348 family)
VADADCLIALHARRSHDVALAWRERYPERPLVVVLTGTDLYRDLPEDPRARESLAVADRLVVLQDDGVRHLPLAQRHKARVVYQSAPRLRPATRPASRVNCIMVGHLREEKDPLTALRAWRRLPADAPIYLTHVGAALDPTLEQAARDFARDEPRYRWLDARPHAWTRQAIKRAHLLLLPSRLEGGANVIVEAVTAGTPVLASRMSGNLGMLGRDYAGYFPVGDERALARLLWRCWREPAFLSALHRQCRSRRELFWPAREQAALRAVLRELL